MVTDLQSCFQIKASFSPCTILQMIRYDLDSFVQQVEQAITRAPQFFIGSPLIIDLDKIKNLGIPDFKNLKQILRKHGLVPVGVRGGSEEQRIAAASEDLPTVNIGKKIVNTVESKVENTGKPSLSKLISTPIRSGMQVYAKDSDLIILSQVSSGAELLADGHIHVYGALRGRALAGMQGNKEARIFCRGLEAELISIAGYYLTKEDIPLTKKNANIQISLENEQLRIVSI